MVDCRIPDSATTAQKRGKQFQNQVCSLLDGYGYTYIEHHLIEAGSILDQPLYCIEYNIPQNLYYNSRGTNIDIVIFVPEAKSQFFIVN